MLPKLFSNPLDSGLVYPCTLDDIESQLRRVPVSDLEGLHAIGLAASTRKRSAIDGCYLYRNPQKPIIAIYSVPADLSFRMPQDWKIGDMDDYKKIERSYGMDVEKQGTRFVCRWNAAGLRQYTLDYILMHELGHHVHLRNIFPARREQIPRYDRERAADDYALRWLKLFGSTT